MAPTKFPARTLSGNPGIRARDNLLKRYCMMRCSVAVIGPDLPGTLQARRPVALLSPTGIPSSAISTRSSIVSIRRFDDAMEATRPLFATALSPR